MEEGRVTNGRIIFQRVAKEIKESRIKVQLIHKPVVSIQMEWT